MFLDKIYYAVRKIIKIQYIIKTFELMKRHMLDESLNEQILLI